MRLSFRLAVLAIVVLIFGVVYSFQGSRAQNIPTDLQPSASCVAAPPGMVAWWSGEGNADDIRGENNGTLQGSPTFPAGKVEHAFGFNGSNQYVSIPDSPSLTPTNLTIDAWVNPTDLTQDRAILIKSALSTGGNDFAYGLRVLNGGHAEGRITDAGGASASVVSTSVLSTNQFQHVAFTYDGAALKLYLNGVLDGTTATNLIPVQNTNPVSIGVWQSVSAGVIQYWLGRIDEVELFDRALSQTEIQGIVDAGSFGKCRPRCVPPPSGMVGWWTGDDNPYDIWSTNHGTFENPTGPAYQDGKVGRAFNFDGINSYVDLDNYFSLKLSTAITIDAWVKPASVAILPGSSGKSGKSQPSQSSGVQGILTKWGQGGNSYGLWLEETDGGFTLRGGINSDGEDFLIEGGTIPPDVFSHVAMTFDSNSGDLVLYVNGVEVATGNNDASMSVTDTNVSIGCETCGGSQVGINPFLGLIDEVEVFDRALSPSEIQDINNGAAAGKCKPCYPPPFGMVGWWNGDANSNDSSGSSNGTWDTVPAYAFGKVGQSFSFNGTDAAVTSSPTGVMNSLPLTIDAWVRPALRADGTVSDFYPSNAVSNDLAGNFGHGFGVNVFSSGGSQMTVEYDAGFISVSGVSFNADQWYHIAVVYTEVDGSGNVKSYVDGQLVNNFSFTQTPVDSANVVYIGKHNDDAATYGTKRFFKGLIDEVEVFNRELDISEIQSIVAAGASGKCKGTCNFVGNEAAKSRARTATSSQNPCFSEQGANQPEFDQTDLVGDVSVTLADTTSQGVTDYQTLPTYQQGPMPFGYGNPLEIADISTTTTFNGSATVCFNLQAVTDQTTFDQLRILHLEGNDLIDRTSSHYFPLRSLCATVSSLSPFLISQNPNAGPTAAPANISGHVTRPDGSPLAGVVIQLSGNTSKLAITDSNGFYSFAELDTNGFYTVTPAFVNYSFTPFQRSLSLLANTTNAVFTGTPNAVVTGSPIDTTGYFVRQHYLDFLNREPDESGFNFWSNSILSCGNDASCLEVKRINASAAYFLSIEFQQTGYLVYRMYKAAYGDLPGAPVPVRFNEFMPDTRQIGQNVIVNQPGWEQTLENNRQAFADAFAARTRFTGIYGAMDDPQFLNRLNQNAGTVLSVAERDDLLASLISRRRTRAQVLRIVAENSQLTQQEFNKAFVLMEYFGYLRRDPNTGPDVDFAGYNFWLSKLNQFNSNFEQAEMVKAFINSSEYRGRFPR